MLKTLMHRIPLAGFVFLSVSSAPLIAEQTCQGLMNIALEHATITSATAVSEGPVSGGGRGGAAPVIVIAPAHCAVQGIIRPTKDSEIHFELWIPASGWNGKYLQLGSGGWAGAINAAGLVEPVKRGYAAAATDDNIMVPILDAVRSYATIGEMCDALRAVWGEYEEVPVI